MTKKIYKYELPTSEVTLQFPADARLLRVGHDPAEPMLPCLWVELDVDLPATETHIFKTYGTGHELEEPEEERHYVGTAVCGPFAWHVFEVPTPEALAGEREYRAAIEASMAANAAAAEAVVPDA